MVSRFLLREESCNPLKIQLLQEHFHSGVKSKYIRFEGLANYS